MAAEAIARAVLSVFRQQSTGGQERFGNWHGRLATALEKPLLDAYLYGLRKHRARDDEWAATQAEAQAREAAVQVNDSTTNMLESGREYREVFSSDRAALIGVDQWDKAVSAAQVRAAQSKGLKLRWVTRGPRVCPTCRKLSGKVRNPGKAFGVWNGEPILAPPVHPSCYCVLEEVRA